MKDVFTQPVSPLRPEHLSGDANAPDDPSVKRYILVDPARSLGDYDRQGITVRVTRANYRTGRLEISAHITLDGFINFMEKQAWRIDAFGLDKMPLGSVTYKWGSQVEMFRESFSFTLRISFGASPPMLIRLRR